MPGELGSSSNPFRRSLQVPPSAAPSSSAVPPPAVSDAPDNTPPKLVPKRVRVASPPISPRIHDEPNVAQRPPTPRHPTFPLPPESIDSESSESAASDPFDSESDDQTSREETQSGGGIAAGVTSSDVNRNNGAPPNPFERTLADAELGRRMSFDSKASRGPSSQGTKPNSGPARASLDVDAFKRLLMTGSAHSTPSVNSGVKPASSHLPPGIIGDSSSGTDASSISRQSLFEPLPETQSETPRTSHEISTSDDERQRVTSEAALAPRPKPPAPQTRHGKPIRSKMPQTVSFTDPSFSSQAFEMGSNPPLASPPTSKTSSDLNKPLPAPPVSASTILDFNNQLPEKIPSNAPDSSAASISSTNSQRRRPPTPPLARRTSQLRSSASGTTRPENLHHIQPDTPGAGPSTSTDKHPVSIKSPPPPPARRRENHQHVAGNVISSPALSSVILDNDSTDTVIRPGSTIQPNSRRSSSLSSSKKMERPPLATRTSTSSSIVPPPPPPARRTRGSSRSSTEVPYGVVPSGRASSEYGRSSLEGGRPSAELTKPIQSGLPDENKDASRDVLADLEALQREVDDLRGKYAVQNTPPV